MFQKILVVVEDPESKTLRDSCSIRKGLALAKPSGSHLRLVQCCYDASAVDSLLPSKDLDASREAVLRQAQTGLTEVARNLGGQGVTASAAVLWGTIEEGVLWDEVASFQPDVIVKTSTDTPYFVGLFSNEDWSLIRECDVPVWFTRSGNPPVTGIAAAVDQVDSESDVDGLDLRVATTALGLASSLGVPVRLLHAFDTPVGLTGYYLHTTFPEGHAAASRRIFAEANVASRKARQELEEEYRAGVTAFARFVGVEPNDVVIAEGRPAEALSEYADATGAGLIVIGASEKNAWQRFWDGANPEETVESSPCDVLVVKQPREVCETRESLSGKILDDGLIEARPRRVDRG